MRVYECRVKLTLVNLTAQFSCSQVKMVLELVDFDKHPDFSLLDNKLLDWKIVNSTLLEGRSMVLNAGCRCCGKPNLHYFVLPDQDLAVEIDRVLGDRTETIILTIPDLPEF